MMRVDCDVNTSGVQLDCITHAGTYAVDVVVTNNTANSTQLGALGFNLITTQSVLDPISTACDPSGLNCNPDFNQSAVTGSFACSPPAPVPDTDPDPGLANSFLGCFNGNVNGPSVAAGASIVIARVHYLASSGSTVIRIMDGQLYDESFGELGTCPATAREMGCPQSSVDTTAATPTFTPTPTSTLTSTPTITETPTNTSTPCPDTDCDGVLDATDNCTSVANADQSNGDPNFIDHSPPFAAFVDDRTSANSDGSGDACDPDDDNDGLADSVEILSLPCVAASGSTSPYRMDTDGDRFVDGVECAFGADPANLASLPPFAVCGSNVDTDGDGLSDRIEVCFYNTDPNNSDTDGDRTLHGAKDGCEAASFNGDRIVNVADMGMLATAIINPAFRVVSVDVNKDGLWNPADQGIVASFISPSGQCPG